MRLHEWHSAKVIVLSTHRQEDDVDMLQLLASVLSASVQDTDHRIQFSRSVWRGILTYGVSSCNSNTVGTQTYILQFPLFESFVYYYHHYLLKNVLKIIS